MENSNSTPASSSSRNPLKAQLTKAGMRIFTVGASIIFTALIVLWVANAMSEQTKNVDTWRQTTATIGERKGYCDIWFLNNPLRQTRSARWSVTYPYQKQTIESTLCVSGASTYDYYDQTTGTVQQITSGRSVSVLVNPANPTKVTLQNGMSPNDSHSQLVAVVWSFIAVGLVIVFYIVLTKIPRLRSGVL